MTRLSERWNTAGSGVPTGWTQRWNTSLNTFTVANNELEFYKGNSTRGLLSMDAANSVQDCDIVTYFRFHDIELASVAATTAGLIARGSGGSTTETGYYCSFFGATTPTGATLVVGKYVAGTSTILSSLAITTIFGVNDSEDIEYRDICMRFSVVGTALKAKVWEVKNAEPVSWTISTTDSSISSAGWTGIFRFSQYSTGLYNGPIHIDDTGTTVEFDKVTGIVKDELGANAARAVKLQHRATQKTSAMSSTTSDGSTGAYTVYTPYGGEHNLIVQDSATTDPLLNDIINRVIPA